MTDTPKMIPYLVAGTFDNGALCVTAIIAHAPEIATAMAVREFVRSIPQEALLNGICAVPLNPDFLRAALRAVEGEPQTGAVLSLVQPAEEPDLSGLAPMFVRAAQPSLGGMMSRDDEPPPEVS
jgi:hypothetical protein